MSLVLHRDLELWATAWVRARAEQIAGDTGLKVTWVSNSERPDELGGRPGAGEAHVVLRDDSGVRRDLILKDSALGVTVLGVSRRTIAPVKALAERLVAVIEADAPLDSTTPVAHVPAVNGPYTVPGGNDEARVYASISLTLSV